MLMIFVMDFKQLIHCWKYENVMFSVFCCMQYFMYDFWTKSVLDLCRTFEKS